MTLDHAPRRRLLITVEPPAKVPTADDYLKETLAVLEKQKATVTATEKPTRVRAEPVQLDRFALDATIGANKLRLEYAVLTADRRRGDGRRDAPGRRRATCGRKWRASCGA